MFESNTGEDIGFRVSLNDLAISVDQLGLPRNRTSISLSQGDAIDISQYPYGKFIRVTSYDRISGGETSFAFVVRPDDAVSTVEDNLRFTPLEKLDNFEKSEIQFAASCASLAIAELVHKRAV